MRNKDELRARVKKLETGGVVEEIYDRLDDPRLPYRWVSSSACAGARAGAERR